MLDACIPLAVEKIICRRGEYSTSHWQMPVNSLRTRQYVWMDLLKAIIDCST